MRTVLIQDEGNIMLSVSDIQRAIHEIAPKYSLEKASLFGSYARGDMNDDSDVDLVIELTKPLGFARGGLYLDLEKELNCPVDIVFGVDNLYPFVKESFDQEAVVLYENN